MHKLAIYLNDSIPQLSQVVPKGRISAAYCQYKTSKLAQITPGFSNSHLLQFIIAAGCPLGACSHVHWPSLEQPRTRSLNSQRQPPLIQDARTACSQHDHAAVHIDGLPGDVQRCRVERQEPHQPGNVLGLAVPPCMRTTSLLCAQKQQWRTHGQCPYGHLEAAPSYAKVLRSAALCPQLHPAWQCLSSQLRPSPL